jgi:hypothetical protein
MLNFTGTALPACAPFGLSLSTGWKKPLNGYATLNVRATSAAGNHGFGAPAEMS